MKKDTKRLLLESGLSKFKLQGYARTGIQEVLRAVGVPKGSFYNYFRSKEEFALQVMNLEAEEDFSNLSENLSGEAGTPLTRLRGHFEKIIAFRRASGDFTGGCILGNMGQEIGDVNDTFASAIEAHFNVRIEVISVCLTQAQAEGELSENCDPHALAEFIYNSWQGALMRMKTKRSIEPLEICLETLFGTFLRLSA